MARMLLADDETATALGELETILVGGEALPQDLAEELAAYADVRVMNMYGPTETTIWSTCAPVEPGELVTIGRPLANQRAYVLDRWLQPVPVGVPGELYIAGEGVTRGYWKQPELTDERFVADPYSAVTPSGESPRMYRTGDLVEYLPDGSLNYLQRVDHQVKVRGYRIELGEIESVLSQHAAIHECAVIAMQRGLDDVRLEAWYTLVAGTRVSAGELRARISESLPDYMVPAAFHELDQMPLTPNRKLDRNALANRTIDAAQSPSEHGTELVLPGRPQSGADDVVSMIQSIWCDALGRDEIGRNENFFDLGGHSLLMVKVQLAIKSRTGIRVPLVDLFRFTTLSTLGEHLASMIDPSDRAEHGSGSLRSGSTGPGTGGEAKGATMTGQPSVGAGW